MLLFSRYVYSKDDQLAGRTQFGNDLHAFSCNRLPSDTIFPLSSHPILLAFQDYICEDTTFNIYVEPQSVCPSCGTSYVCIGEHAIVVRTLFGTMHVPSPRFYTCDGQPQPTTSCSPLAACLPERTAPELLYLAAKLAALMSSKPSASLAAPSRSTRHTFPTTELAIVTGSLSPQPWPSRRCIRSSANGL